jgi:phage gp37-like protein
MPAQNNLFEDLPVDRYLGQSKDALTLVISIPKLGVQQKLFNDLLAKIEKTSQDLEDLKKLEAEHRPERDRKLHPLEQETLQLQQQLIIFLDQRLQTPKGLSKKQMADVRYIASTMADGVFVNAQMSGRQLSPDIMVVIDRLLGIDRSEDAVFGEADDGRGDNSMDEGRQSQQSYSREELNALKQSMSSMMGVDLDDVEDFDSPETLMAAAMRKMQSERETAQQAHQAKQAQRKKSPKQLLAEQETMDADSALRTIYRKLASALHPDREPNEAERIRKTELMGRVNAANDAKDLLTMLRLQLHIEQIDPLAIATLADDKLRHYNRMLKDQFKTLQLDLQRMQFRLREEWDLNFGAITGKSLQAALRSQTQEIQARNAYFQQDLASIQDDKYLKAWAKNEIKQMGSYLDSSLDMMAFD